VVSGASGMFSSNSTSIFVFDLTHSIAATRGKPERWAWLCYGLAGSSRTKADAKSKAIWEQKEEQP
jgi:hypothetical protein